ncbi:MAG: hypothetical protein EA384_15535 [Spirochaetaceae bacterium]|nr:MAG: hypothetical protein EA384_15535 [Spirochaetaceae bacterium]
MIPRFRAVLPVLLVVMAAAVAVPVRGDYQLSSITFLPQQFYVGDRVEMRVGVRSTAAVGLSVPEVMPQVEWGDLHHVRLVPRGTEWEVRVIFTAFRPGTRTIPPLDLGAFTVSDLSVHIPSILETQGRSEPAPPQEQAALPGTRLWITLFAVLLLLLPLLWIFTMSRGRRYLQEFIRRYRERQPYRRLVRALKTLSAGIEQMDGREFYIMLLEHIRRYLSTRLRADCMSATTAELDAYLEQLLFEAEDRRKLLELFRHGDLVKFAALPAPAEQRSEHITDLRAVADNLEQRRHARQARLVRRRVRERTARRGRERVGV